MKLSRLNATERREFHKLTALANAGGTQQVTTGRETSGIDSRSALALAGKDMVRIDGTGATRSCTISRAGEERLARLRARVEA